MNYNNIKLIKSETQEYKEESIIYKKYGDEY